MMATELEPTHPVTSVLIVDDEPAVRDLMARWVSSLGLRPHTAANADEALATLRGTHYDLAVIDVMMPGRDGLWLAGQLRRDHPNTALVIATGYTEMLGDPEKRPPAADFLVKPFARERFNLAVDRGRHWRKRVLEELQWHAQLSLELQDRVHQICVSLRRTGVGGQPVDVLTALARTRTPQTVAHAERVTRFALSTARGLGIEARSDAGRLLESAARFHDIGKAAMPDALVNKPSALTPGEMAIMRRHADVGAEILGVIPALAPVAPLVLATHEWFGGDGYPRKLSGEAIPLASRIIAVADAYDAMTQDRAYRRHLDSSDAIAELLRSSPVQFDPRVVDAFLVVLGQH